MALKAAVFFIIKQYRQDDMSRKNYLKDIEPYKDNKAKPKIPFTTYAKAFLAYLNKPKTVFDFKDRTKFIILLAIIIILLQKVVEIIAD